MKEEFDVDILEWNNLVVKVQPKTTIMGMFKKKKDKPRPIEVLKGVSGYAKSNRMVALLGASGAGKTTLLNALSWNLDSSMKLKGNIIYNGVSNINIKKISGFIQQMDLFFYRFKVKEHLQFYMKLSCGQEISKSEIKNKINEIYNQFNLKKCSDVIIGDGLNIKGISGGERKRLSLATELIKNPNIIFADEPTSGLDSFMAETVIECFYNISRMNKIVICTIHQPSSIIIEKFDDIIIMTDGMVLTCDPLSDVLNIFKLAGHPLPENCNPADHFIRKTAIMVDQEEECIQIINSIKKIKDECYPNEINLIKSSNKQNFIKQKSQFKANIFTQLRQLLYREYIRLIRDPSVLYFKIGENLTMGLLLGLIYFQLLNATSSIQSVMGALFFFVIQSSKSSINQIIMIFPAELLLFNREHRFYLYRTVPYFLSKTIADIPGLFISVLIVISVSYWMIGLNNLPLTFFLMFLMLFLMIQSSVSFGYLISTIAPTIEMANAIADPMLLPLMLFGGFFVTNINIPVYFIWIRYISWFNYAFESMAILQYRGLDLLCDQPKLCKILTGKVVSGDYAFQLMGINKNNLNINIIALVILAVGYRIISLIILLAKTYFNEKS